MNMGVQGSLGKDVVRLGAGAVCGAWRSPRGPVSAAKREGPRAAKRPRR